MRQTFPGSLRLVGDREFKIIAITARLGRDGHILVPSGVDLSEYRKVPAVLWMHADVDRRRDLIIVAGKPCPLTALHWQKFMLLYRHHGGVVYADRIHAKLHRGVRERPPLDIVREHVRRLRRVLIGSRCRIVNYRGSGIRWSADPPGALETLRPASTLPVNGHLNR